MLNGILKLIQFKYQIGEGTGPKGEEIKIIVFQDFHSQVQIHIIMTKEQAEEFERQLRGGNILAATELPNGSPRQPA